MLYTLIRGEFMDALTKIIKTYYHVRSRCYNSDHKSYANYGGRGIVMCEEWLTNRESFVKWAMETGCKEGLAIDRIDNNGPYSPENCRWVTPQENNQNRRTSKFYTLNGITLNLQQWCDKYGLPRSMVEARMKRGWSFEKSISTKKRERQLTDMDGKRFGRLTVIKFDHVGNGRKSVYKCVCDCGKITYVDKTKLTGGHTQSCGCLRTEMYEAMKYSKDERG
jgi:hypothetical protein